jgi:hypothetical protein
MACQLDTVGRIYSEEYMTGKYRIEIELLLDESTATQALALAKLGILTFNVVVRERWKVALNER